MKALNTLLKFTLVAAVTVTISTACENIDNPDPIPAIDSTKTATIQGTAYANLDETNDTTGVPEQDNERAPQGTTVKVVLDVEDLIPNPTPGVNYSSKTYTTTVDANGNFSVEVEAADAAINVELYMGSFNATRTLGGGGTEQALYLPQLFPYNVQIVAGLTSYNDVTYFPN